jgi:hypothetical protein
MRSPGHQIPIAVAAFLLGMHCAVASVDAAPLHATFDASENVAEFIIPAQSSSSTIPFGGDVIEGVLESPGAGMTASSPPSPPPGLGPVLADSGCEILLTLSSDRLQLTDSAWTAPPFLLGIFRPPRV